jgi:hypothetical protein
MKVSVQGFSGSYCLEIDGLLDTGVLLRFKDGAKVIGLETLQHPCVNSVLEN